MRRRFVVPAIAFTLALFVSHATAQEAAPAGPPPPPPYDEQMLRLSEILGAVHYLRHLCKDDEETLWRTQMEALLEAENPDEIRRQRMVDRFNRGYEGFRSVYRTCTTTASVAADRYLQEGAKLTAEITARYGSSD